MSDPIDRKLNENLRRWQESGQPQLWCAAHRGAWNHEDWLTLVGSLWWSEYWPMEPAAVRAVLEDVSRPWNLKRWQESSAPWRWIESHHGIWGHDDWLALLESLRQSEFWPLDPAEAGCWLESLVPLWSNLERWKQSGLPARWVEARQGVWSHADWLGLLDTLRQSEYWPLDPIRVGETLEALKRNYHNLIRWERSGHPRRWIEVRRGNWDESAWQSLLTALRTSEYWPLDASSVNRVLECHQREWWNLERWRESGLARRWVEVHDGRWNHDDWLELLASLRATGYWPVDPDAVGGLLEETRTEWSNLRDWEASGQPQAWIDAQPRGWGDAALDALFESLWQTEFWPLDTRSVQVLLQRLETQRAADVRGADLVAPPEVLRMPLPVTRRAA
jgi:hypothetical protein